MNSKVNALFKQTDYYLDENINNEQSSASLLKVN